MELVQLELSHGSAVAEEGELEYAALAFGDVRRELEGAEALFTLAYGSVVLFGRSVIDRAGVEVADGNAVGLTVARVHQADKSVGVGQETVDHVVTDDGRGDADVLDLQRRGRGHFDGVLVKDGEVGQLAFFNGADQAFNVILVGRGDGHRVDGLEWVEALIEIPEFAFSTALRFRIHGLGAQILAGTAENLTARAGTGHGGLNAAQAGNRGYRGVVVGREVVTVGGGPTLRVLLLAASGAHVDLQMAIAPEIGVVDEVRRNEVLILDQLAVLEGGAQIGSGPLLAMGVGVRSFLAGGTAEIPIHFGGSVQLVVLADGAFDDLALFHLAMDERMPEVFDRRMVGHSQFDGGHVVFRRPTAVGVGFNGLVVFRVKIHAGDERFPREVEGTVQAEQRVGSIGIGLASDRIITGIGPLVPIARMLEVTGIALIRTVINLLPRTEQQVVLGKCGRIILSHHKAGKVVANLGGCRSGRVVKRIWSVVRIPFQERVVGNATIGKR